MAIISCPSCNKSISDKHKHCPHCDTAFAELNEEELQEIAARAKFRRRQRLTNESFIALMLFLSGFLYLYSRTPAQGSLELMICRGAIAVGIVWYLVNRVRLVILKRK